MAYATSAEVKPDADDRHPARNLAGLESRGAPRASVVFVSAL
jgi:hypothetical protein